MIAFLERRASCALIALVGLMGAAPASAACQLAKYLDLPVTMRGRQPIVTAQLNGRDAEFILDSGAFWSTLSQATAQQFGLKIEPIYGLRLKGIGGEADASVAKVKSFGISTATIPNVDFLVGGTDTGRIGLLGQNVLQIGDVEYDLPHGGLRVLKATGCETGQYVYWAAGRPMTLVELEPDKEGDRDHTIGTVVVNGQKLRAIFDTGASGSIMSLAAAKRAGLMPDSPGVVDGGETGGIGTRMTRRWVGTFESIDIGGERINHPKIAFADIQLGGDMLIGVDFFLTHRIYVSNKQRKMFVTYEGGPLFGLKPTGARTDSGERIDLTDKSGAPTDAEGFARRAAVAESNGRMEEAVADLDKAIALDPKQGRYYRQRAMTRRPSKGGVDSIADLDKAIALDPADVEARSMRAGMRLGAHRAEAAMEDLRALDTTLPPGDGRRLMLAGMADVAGHPELALANYNAWLKSHPQDANRYDALNGRCFARAELNRELDAALDDCNAALKLRPGSAAILDSRALARFRQGNFKAALADYDAALKAGPDLAWSLYMRGLVKTKLGDTAGAKADHDAAIKIDAHVLEQARTLGLEA